MLSHCVYEKCISAARICKNRIQVINVSVFFLIVCIEKLSRFRFYRINIIFPHISQYLIRLIDAIRQIWISLIESVVLSESKSQLRAESLKFN